MTTVVAETRSLTVLFSYATHRMDNRSHPPWSALNNPSSQRWSIERVCITKHGANNTREGSPRTREFSCDTWLPRMGSLYWVLG